MEFKVGDKVKVKSWHDLVEKFGIDKDGDIKCMPYFVKPMRHFCGETVTIKECCDSFYRIEEDQNYWNFAEGVFEPVARFKVGDRVRAIKAYDGNSRIIGETGTIIRILDNKMGVQFDNPINGHSCGFKENSKHCWWCSTDILEPITEFKVGQIYEVNMGCIEKGNVIKITDVRGEYIAYETLKGKTIDRSVFDKNSLFAKNLKLINVCENKIVITTDGVTTTAKMYDGKTVVKTATAKCAPDDTFEFETGAKIAFERLTGFVPESTNTFDWDKFKAGKLVVHCTKDNYDGFIAEAKKHGCKFHNGESPNPFEGFAPRFLRRMLNDPLPDDEIILSFEDGELKFVMHNSLTEAEIFRW